MKTTVAARAVVILTGVSLIACIGGASVSALAAQQGMGGGSNVGHNTPSHPSAFGRGFASSLVANGLGVSGPGTLTSRDHWGPNNTVAFGNPTNGWGPNAVNERPGSYSTPANLNPGGQPISCPCVVAYDPFNKRINGGVDVPEAKLLANGVTDFTSLNMGNDSGASFAVSVEGALMSAVWGPNFNTTRQQQMASGSGHQQVWSSDRQH
jgi:hypothetical protein